MISKSRLMKFFIQKVVKKNKNKSIKKYFKLKSRNKIKVQLILRIKISDRPKIHLKKI